MQNKITTRLQHRTAVFRETTWLHHKYFILGLRMAARFIQRFRLVRRYWYHFENSSSDGSSVPLFNEDERRIADTGTFFFNKKKRNKANKTVTLRFLPFFFFFPPTSSGCCGIQLNWYFWEIVCVVSKLCLLWHRHWVRWRAWQWAWHFFVLFF